MKVSIRWAASFCISLVKPGVGMLPHKFVKLFIQAVAKLFGIGGEVELVCFLHTEHSEHPLLQPLVIVLQGKV